MSIVISIDDSIVATLSGSRFHNNVSVVGTGSFGLGLSGSLTRLENGTSYLAAGSNATVASASNGQVTISFPGAPNDASYVCASSESGLSSERVVSGSGGVLHTDNGAGSTLDLTLVNSYIKMQMLKQLAGLRMNVMSTNVTSTDEFGIYLTNLGSGLITARANTDISTRLPTGTYTSATTDNAQAGRLVSAANRAWWYRQDGFWLATIFGFSTWAVTNRKSWCGLDATAVSTTSPINGTTQPTSLTDMVGVGMDSGDTQLYIMHNDNAGTATKVATGITAATGTLYLLVLYCSPSGNIDYDFRDIGAGTEVNGTLSTDLPTAATLMRYCCVASNGASAGTTAIALRWAGVWSSAMAENSGITSF